MSFLTVILAAFQNLFSSPGSLFAILAMVGVVLGWGIFQIICMFIP